MKINLELYTKFSREELDDLWGQNVNMDDWDYAFITHDIHLFEEAVEVDEFDGTEFPFATPCDSHVADVLELIMSGCYENKWYPIEWNGQPAVIGIAYHG